MLVLPNLINQMGNGAKAAMKRERNAKGGSGEAKSQLKSVNYYLDESYVH